MKTRRPFSSLPPSTLRSGSWLAGLLFAGSLFAGCAQSHLRGGEGPRCGPTTCAAGQECCNESCGICTAPGERCSALVCGDAGPIERCGGGVCRGGDLCCPSCPGEADFCVSGRTCPELDCPPPPTCDECPVGATCCEACPGEPRVCSFDGICPDFICPPPFECDEDLPCAAGSYCARPTGVCGGPGECAPRPDGCFGVCGAVCGCDGITYCNECEAARTAGVGVARGGACGDSCAGREFCDCSGECEPLIDLSRGCVCSCDDPFNCSGDDCDCDCGGARYLGCAAVGQCADVEVTCDPGCDAVLDETGCPTLCSCIAPG